MVQMNIEQRDVSNIEKRRIEYRQKKYKSNNN